MYGKDFRRLRQFEMVSAGFGERAPALPAGGEAGTASVDGGQFAAHNLHDRDAQVRAGTYKVLKTRDVDKGQPGVLQRDRSRIVRLAAQGSGQTQDAARAKVADKGLRAVLGEDGDTTTAGTNDEGSPASASLLKDKLSRLRDHRGGQREQSFHEFGRQLEGTSRTWRNERDGQRDSHRNSYLIRNDTRTQDCDACHKFL